MSEKLPAKVLEGEVLGKDGEPILGTKKSTPRASGFHFQISGFRALFLIPIGLFAFFFLVIPIFILGVVFGKRRR